ncbi:MAG TPA: hypothetical protein VGR92_10970, partial [Steroidobacteraceae bacterium]|nr:hypothetical protein [Steroidobacteraceae bacterium]
LWRTFNVVQENVLRGGIVRRTASGRLMRTRAIQAIREDVRLNAGLWVSTCIQSGPATSVED